MVFSSLTFLFIFLPVLTVLYFVCRNRTYRNAVLLAGSLLFYAWGEPKNIILLLAATLSAYIGGFVIARSKHNSAKKAALVIVTVLLLGNLFFFKYFNFTAGNVAALFGIECTLRKIALPIGISFYTFQILSYEIDLYRGEIQLQRSYFRLLLYVSLFPQLIAGPIVRYRTVENEIAVRHESAVDVARGLERFILGLSKKVIIANNVAVLCNAVYASQSGNAGTAAFWMASLAYTLQIYYDFSGYSDMAIGLGRMFGFHFLENFDYPYISLSVTEFWRRWHISLSTWFRDYVYIPLGGNRCGRARWIFNFSVVWLLTGLWHGAEWNFILWGLYYLILLLAEKLWISKINGKLPAAVRWVLTFAVINIGWVIFNITDIPSIGRTLACMFTLRATDFAGLISENTDIIRGMLFLIPGLIFMFPIQRKHSESIGGRAAGYCICAGLLGICVMFIISSGYNPFIYFRF